MYRQEARPSARLVQILPNAEFGEACLLVKCSHRLCYHHQYNCTLGLVERVGEEANLGPEERLGQPFIHS